MNGIRVFDGFYKDPDKVRNFALTLPFDITGNFPGHRTRQVVEWLEQLKASLEAIMSGTINDSFMIDSSPAGENNYNNTFQIVKENVPTWIHSDLFNNTAALIYLSPDPPLDTGTLFYRRIEDQLSSLRGMDLAAKEQIQEEASLHPERFEVTDRVVNIYNRLIIYNSHMLHQAAGYFGKDIPSGRLTQCFFFDSKEVQ